MLSRISDGCPANSTRVTIAPVESLRCPPGRSSGVLPSSPLLAQIENGSLETRTLKREWPGLGNGKASLKRTRTSASRTAMMKAPVATSEAKVHPCKERRSQRRQELYREKANLLALHGRSLLEEESVGQHSQRTYAQVLVRLAGHLGHAVWSGVAAGAVDKAIVKLMTEMYLDGESHSAGSTLFAAVGWKMPRFSMMNRHQLSRSMVALKGFRKLAPTYSRLPLPMVVVYGLSMMMASLGEYHAALGCLLAFSLYLRPGELLQARWRHLSRPMGRKRGGALGWTLSLHPFEEGVPSKVMEYDSTSSVDGDNKDINDIVAHMYDEQKLKGQLDDYIVEMTGAQTYGQVFRRAAGKLLLVPCPVPHQLRHAGASYEYASQKKSIADVKRKGRWSSDSAVRRYEKSGRINEQLAKLDLKILEYCENSVKHIKSVLCRCSPPLST